MAQLTLAEKLAALREKTATTNNTPTVVEEKKEIAKPAQESIAERLARLKSASSNSEPKSKNVPAVVNTPKPANSVSLSTLGQAIRAKPELPDELHEKAPANVHMIREKIYELQHDCEGISLKDKMLELRNALLENPTAVNFMLPEDFGEMVRHIRKLTGNAVAQALAKPTNKRSAGKTKAPIENVSIDDLQF